MWSIPTPLLSGSVADLRRVLSPAARFHGRRNWRTRKSSKIVHIEQPFQRLQSRDTPRDTFSRNVTNHHFPLSFFSNLRSIPPRPPPSRSIFGSLTRRYRSPASLSLTESLIPRAMWRLQNWTRYSRRKEKKKKGKKDSCAPLKQLRDHLSPLFPRIPDQSVPSEVIRRNSTFFSSTFLPFSFSFLIYSRRRATRGGTSPRILQLTWLHPGVYKLKRGHGRNIENNKSNKLFDYLYIRENSRNY